MSGPRKPKNLDNYSPFEIAAKGLEDFAADMRKNGRKGDLVRWSLNVSFWNPDWERKPKHAPPPSEASAQEAKG